MFLFKKKGSVERKLIVGLGNPGEKYENTRHNVGFMVLDQLAKRWNVGIDREKFKGLLGEKTDSERVLLLKPMTYMNLSGESVSRVTSFYKIDPEQVLVIYDEMDLPLGKLRLRYKGSAGGHNGVKSLIQHLGTEEFKRIRIGVGKPNSGKAAPDYLLSSIPPAEREVLDEAVERAADAAEAWLTQSFAEVMNQYNR